MVTNVTIAGVLPGRLYQVSRPQLFILIDLRTSAWDMKSEECLANYDYVLKKRSFEGCYVVSTITSNNILTIALIKIECFN
jgi:hypothetical protein